ncbi:MAG: Hsp20 family protein [Desulfobulbaceae bacterium]|nr:Hsp20 family protein [Desulfobulbaceae bacterium]
MSEQELQVQEKKMAPHSGETTKPEKYFVPTVDIYETEEEVMVVAEMPGVDENGADVSLEDNVLTIQGNNAPKEEGSDVRMLLQEYETGHYLRRFTVAETIDQENIAATMSDGVLTVTLPKTKPVKPRKIDVKIG